MKRYLLFGGDTYYPSGGGLDFKGFFESEEAARESFSDWPEDWGQIFEDRGNDLYRVGFYGRNMNHPGWPETEEREKTWMQYDYDRSPIGMAEIYATALANQAREQRGIIPGRPGEAVDTGGGVLPPLRAALQTNLQTVERITANDTCIKQER